jgi:hypothetical protein
MTSEGTPQRRGYVMKDWFVPPIVIPSAIVVALAIYAVFRFL